MWHLASLISFIRSNPGLKRPFPGAYRYCRGLPDFFHYRFGTFYHLVGWSAVRIIILSASIIPQLLLSFFFSIIFFLQLRGEWCFLLDKEERRLNSVLFSVRKKKIGMIKKKLSGGGLSSEACCAKSWKWFTSYTWNIFPFRIFFFYVFLLNIK